MRQSNGEMPEEGKGRLVIAFGQRSLFFCAPVHSPRHSSPLALFVLGWPKGILRGERLDLAYHPFSPSPNGLFPSQPSPSGPHVRASFRHRAIIWPRRCPTVITGQPWQRGSGQTEREGLSGEGPNVPPASVKYGRVAWQSVSLLWKSSELTAGDGGHKGFWKGKLWEWHHWERKRKS